MAFLIACTLGVSQMTPIYVNAEEVVQQQSQQAGQESKDEEAETTINNTVEGVNEETDKTDTAESESVKEESVEENNNEETTTGESENDEKDKQPQEIKETTDNNSADDTTKPSDINSNTVEETTTNTTEQVNTEEINKSVVLEKEIPAETKAVQSDFVIENGVLKKYNGAASNVIIPEGVTAIAEEAFNNSQTIKSVTIPDQVTEIGSRAFSHCLNLVSVKLPSNLTAIPYGLFMECENLRDIVIPDTVTTIGESAFLDCQSLSNINLPNGLIVIESSTFQDCINLENIAIPESVQAIKMRAFAFSGLKEINLPNGITTIEEATFSSTKLTNIVIPDSVTKIGVFAFYNCENLTNIEIPSKVTRIESSAFSSCTRLTEVVLPQGITSIGNTSFSSCESLQKISLPDTLTEIGDRAFENCINLSSITISNQVSSIGKDTFYGCNHGKVYKQNTNGTATNYDSYFKIYCNKDSYAYTYAINNQMVAITPESNNILVTSLELNKSKIKLAKNASVTLRAEVYPKDSTNANVVWSSSDENVASVTQEGVVTAIEEGTATITVMAQDEGKVSKTCEISVPKSKSYKIKYKLNGGKNASENPNYYAKGVKLKLENPTKKGYLFTGWYNGEEKITSINKTNTGKITLTAQWEKVKVDKTTVSKVKNTYSGIIDITFQKVNNIDGYTVFYADNKELNNASFKDVSAKKKEARISKLENGKTYYVTVKAYKKDSEGNKIYGKSNKVVKTTLEYAKQYKIKYKLDNGTNASTNPEYYTTGITLSLDNPSREEYEFLGWYNGEKKVTSVSKKETGTITLKAKWKKIKLNKTVVLDAKNDKKGQLKISFEKQSNVNGYTVFYAQNKSLTDANTKNISSKKKSVTIKNLEKGTTYYVTVKAYKLDSAGNKVYGTSNQTIKIKVKK